MSSTVHGVGGVATTAWLLAMCLATGVLAAAASAGDGLARLDAGSASATDGFVLLECTDRMLQAIDHAEGMLPQMAATADVVARRWIAGAQVFAAGDTSFSDEIFYRAGGLIGMRRVGPARKSNGRTVPWGEVPKESIILYGLHRSADPYQVVFEELSHVAANKDTVVLFASGDWPVTRKALKTLHRDLPADKVFFIDTHLPVDTRLRTRQGAAFGNYAGMATATHAWTFMSELISACTRQGKMPGVWPSLTIPRYEAWEKKYETIRFHDDFTTAPIDPGVLGGQYLQTLREQLLACPASASQVKAAAKMLANVPADKTVYVMAEGHLLPGETQLPMELRNWLIVQRSWRWPQAARTIDRGDAIFWLGYLAWPDKEAAQAIEQGNPFVGVSVRGPGQVFHDEPLVTPGTQPSSQPVAAAQSASKAASATQATTGTPTSLPASVVWVPALWQYPDSVVEIPGYPVKACPTSGIVQGTILWGLIGEVMQASRR